MWRKIFQDHDFNSGFPALEERSLPLKRERKYWNKAISENLRDNYQTLWTAGTGLILFHPVHKSFFMWISRFCLTWTKSRYWNPMLVFPSIGKGERFSGNYFHEHEPWVKIWLDIEIFFTITKVIFSKTTKPTFYRKKGLSKVLSNRVIRFVHLNEWGH